MKSAVKTFVAICMALMLWPVQALAQQALGGGSKIVSPEIHVNNTVTFRLRAPKAMKVQVVSDCIPKGIAELVETRKVYGNLQLPNHWFLNSMVILS